MFDKDHGILPDASVEGPPFDTLNRADCRKNGTPATPELIGATRTTEHLVSSAE